MAQRFVLAALLASWAAGLGAAQPSEAASSSASGGSTAFCLYELPPEGDKRRWVNLGIVQYLEFNKTEIRMYYGGGNLGSGHEARFPATDAAQVDEILGRLRQAAANCR